MIAPGVSSTISSSPLARILSRLPSICSTCTFMSAVLEAGSGVERDDSVAVGDKPGKADTGGATSDSGAGSTPAKSDAPASPAATTKD